MTDKDDKPAVGQPEITDQPEIKVDDLKIGEKPPAVAPGFTPEQFQQMIQAQFQAIVGEVLGILQAFAPHLSDPEAITLAQHVANEQMDQNQIPTIIRSMVSTDAVAKHPTLHLWVTDSKGVKIELKAPKRLENIKDLLTAAQSVLLLAFLIAPGARAIMRAYGFKYALAQSQTPAGGRVILSS